MRGLTKPALGFLHYFLFFFFFALHCGELQTGMAMLESLSCLGYSWTSSAKLSSGVEPIEKKRKKKKEVIFSDPNVVLKCHSLHCTVTSKNI